jgi:hypothetical protein
MGGGLVLYGTSACHLCEVAQEMLEHHRAYIAEIHYVKSDISESDDLFHRYAIRIPVLQKADGAELDWPFSAQQLELFLAG